MENFSSLFEDFQKATIRLGDALKQEKNEFMRDSAIQRFEIVFDLAWKCLKELLEEKSGAICKSPKACFKEGFAQGILDHSDFWLKLTSDRNYTAHIYKEQMADKIYSELPEALKYFQDLLQKIKEQKDK